MRSLLVVLVASFLMVGIPEATQLAAAAEWPSWATEGGQRGVEEAIEKRDREEAQAKEQAERERAAEEAQSRQASEQAEREHAQVAQQAAEQKAKEEAERSAEEAAERKASEAADARCVVPNLLGKSLEVARSALRKARCRVGRVSMPRGRHGALVVTAQSIARGKRLPQGAAVGLRLGLRRH